MIATNAEQEQYYQDEAERLRVEYFMDSIAEDLWVDPAERDIDEFIK
jgi:hypothetical protein